ncbi:MAG TPA: ATP-binding protein [Blastocatellia bacterium]|nr:ATP-binding protein [Blastocatellia bacterium]
MSEQRDGLRNPYVGPVPFESKDKDLFFGRDEESEMLLSLVISERIVVFYAPSGAGKSSLLNARLIPRLNEKKYTVLPSVRVGGDLPPDVPASRVKNIFVFNALISLVSAKNLGSLPSEDLSDVLKSERLKPEEGGRGSYLILDQFEELFTNHIEHWEKREDFFKQLRMAMEADPKLNLIFVLREDYIAELSNYTHLLPENMRVRFRMERLKYTFALQAIKGPAESRGCAFQPSVAEKLVDDLRKLRKGVIETVVADLREHGVKEASIQQLAADLRQADSRESVKQKLEAELPKLGVKEAASGRLMQEVSKINTMNEVLGEYVEPVYLQIVCYQLWNGLQLKQPREITSNDLLQCGDVTRALTRFYEDGVARVVEECGKAEIKQWGDRDAETEVRRWFSDVLITPTRVRAQVNRGEIESEGVPEAVVNMLLKQNLIRAEQARGGRWLELAHDRLIPPILDANKRWFSERETPLEAAARIWEENGRDPSFLYRGSRLARAQKTFEQNKDSLNELVGEFITQSVSRQVNYSRGLKAAVVLLLLSLGGAVWFGIYAITQARIAKAEKEKANAAAEEAKASQEETIKALKQIELAQIKQSILTSNDIQSNFAKRVVKNNDSKTLNLLVDATNERQKLLEATDADHRRLITIVYFAKDSDEEAVKSSLTDLGFHYEEGKKINPMPTNTLWFGSSLTTDEVKLIAFSLLRAGVDLKCIEAFNKTGRDNVVQVGHDPSNEGKARLTFERINEFMARDLCGS